MKDVLKTAVKTIVRLSDVHHHYQAWRSSALLPPFPLLLLLLGWFRQFNSSSETQQKLNYLCLSLVSSTPNHMHRKRRDRDQREDDGAENSSLIIKPFPFSIDEHPYPCGVVFWLFPGLKLGPLTAPSHFGLHVFAQVTTPDLWCCCGLLLIWATRWLTVTFGCDHHVERILITPPTLPTPLSALIMAHNLMNSLDFSRLTHWRLPISAVLWADANTNRLC